jgi:tetratricopeptide (TPR) repeat protein
MHLVVATTLVVTILFSFRLIAQERDKPPDYTIEELTSRLNENPKDCIARYDLAIAYTFEGAYEQAVSEYREVIAQGNCAIKDNATYNLAIVYMLLQDEERVKEIIEHFRENEAAKPTMSGTTQRLEEMAKLSMDEILLSLCKSEIEHRPSYWVAHVKLGDVSKRLGKFKEAVSAYKSALLLKPNMPMVYNSLGEAYGRLNQTEIALESFQEAIRLDSTLIPAYTNLGVAYGKLRKYKEAIIPLQEAIQRGTKDPMNYYSLGLCYLFLNDRTSALKTYEILKELDAGMAKKLKARIEW